MEDNCCCTARACYAGGMSELLIFSHMGQGSDPILFTIFVIFFGATVLATLALYARQALLVSYIVLGMVLGSAGIDLLRDDQHIISEIANIGIMFLLFLLGLQLPPQKLRRLVKETTFVTVASFIAFQLAGFLLAMAVGFDWLESAVIATAVSFSSTIIGLKLLPTTVLHHQHTGEIITSVLLLQDVLAIGALLLLRIWGGGEAGVSFALMTIIAFPLLFYLAHWCERHIIRRLLYRFDRLQEYMFLLAIGWCLLIAQIAAMVGLTYEIGAFIAGVAMARHPIALVISDKLRPLRDFFLIIFFFSIGAGFSQDVWQVLPVAALFAIVALVGKPLLFRWLLKRSGEPEPVALEMGMRLGQLSEFSMLIAFLALEVQAIGVDASNTIQLATIITLMISPYLIVTRYPSPMAISDHLRRD